LHGNLPDNEEQRTQISRVIESLESVLTDGIIIRQLDGASITVHIEEETIRGQITVAIQRLGEELRNRTTEITRGITQGTTQTTTQDQSNETILLTKGEEIENKEEEAIQREAREAKEKIIEAVDNISNHKETQNKGKAIFKKILIVISIPVILASAFFITNSHFIFFSIALTLQATLGIFVPIMGLAVIAIIASLLSIRNANKNIKLQNATLNIENAGEHAEIETKMLEPDEV
jgi:hypothetical protein